jgi:putative transposase
MSALVRRIINGRARWNCQLIQHGAAPLLRQPVGGVVGLDIGPSAIAAVSSQDAILEQFRPEVEEPWQEIRRIQRAMERSRRATNAENYHPDGTVRKGAKRWRRSQCYRRRQRRQAEIERKLAQRRKRAHGRLGNRILGQGNTIETEKLSYQSFQKNFGRSVKVRAPGMLISQLRRKAEGAGGGMVEINPRKTALSQFDHTTAEYVKKPLSQRIHVFGDGHTAPVQRDLYSAFVASCCDTDSLDIRQVNETWPAVQPLLQRAMSRTEQPASGRGFALPQVRPGLGVDRASKRDGRLSEAADAYPDASRARAAESLKHGSLRTLLELGFSLASEVRGSASGHGSAELKDLRLGIRLTNGSRGQLNSADHVDASATNPKQGTSMFNMTIGAHSASPQPRAFSRQRKRLATLR